MKLGCLILLIHSIIMTYILNHTALSNYTITINLSAINTPMALSIWTNTADTNSTQTIYAFNNTTLYQQNNTLSTNTLTISTNILISQWNHIYFLINNSITSCYLNSNNPTQISPPLNFTSIIVGQNSGGTQVFNGSISNIQVWTGNIADIILFPYNVIYSDQLSYISAFLLSFNYIDGIFG